MTAPSVSRVFVFALQVVVFEAAKGIGSRFGSACTAGVLLVGLLFPLDQLEQDHLPALIVDIVEETVRTDSESIFGRELRDGDMSGQLLAALPFGPGMRGEPANSLDNGSLIVGGNLFEDLLEVFLDAVTGKDDLVGH